MAARCGSLTSRGKALLEHRSPPLRHYRGSAAAPLHITSEDNSLLYALSHQALDFGESEWIHYSGSGYLIRLDAWSFPILRLRRLGLSKACRRLIVTLMRHHAISIVHLDAFGEVLPGFTTFDW